ncbi:hypothetical protein M514_26867 [Trichuris suis]|uniref:Uncharacterized protein n=1 Tax=Trichuris suis TaxID=68888 RepID=A0A085MUS3_9BILA|nr:hypothetical protein M514_26867 [Trichuris suis]
MNNRIGRLNKRESRMDSNYESCPKLFPPYYRCVTEAMRRIARDLGLTVAFESHLNLRLIL